MNSFISISVADQNNLKQLDDLDCVGAIFGDVYNLSGISDTRMKIIRSKIVDNPDCWFVFKPENHGYKDLNNSRFKFGEALDLLKQGFKIAREEWIAEFLVYIPSSKIIIDQDIPYSSAGLTGECKIKEHISLVKFNNLIQFGWSPNQTDILAEDWIILD